MAMSEAAKKSRNKYKREWNKKNPGKQKQYTETYWEKRAKEMQEREEAVAEES